ncbi:unnamed protein product, partial [Rotaria magnacalcarata]
MCAHDHRQFSTRASKCILIGVAVWEIITAIAIGTSTVICMVMTN